MDRQYSGWTDTETEQLSTIYNTHKKTINMDNRKVVLISHWRFYRLGDLGYQVVKRSINRQ